MGQKIHPTGFRLPVTRAWASRWFASNRNFAGMLAEDLQVRDYLKTKLKNAAVSRILIERPAKNARITIFSARPGVVIGKKGEDIENLKAELAKRLGVPVAVNIEEVRKPEVDAQLIADSITQQLEKRIMFRRAMKRAMQNAMRLGAQGIKIMSSGRLNGIEIARCEWYREGRVPLHTLKADIDYGFSEAKTTYGVIGVKVWVYRGDRLANGEAPVRNQDRRRRRPSPASWPAPGWRPSWWAVALPWPCRGPRRAVPGDGSDKPAEARAGRGPRPSPAVKRVARRPRLRAAPKENNNMLQPASSQVPQGTEGPQHGRRHPRCQRVLRRLRPQGHRARPHHGPPDRSGPSCHLAPHQARWPHLHPHLPGQADLAEAGRSPHGQRQGQPGVLRGRDRAGQGAVRNQRRARAAGARGVHAGGCQAAAACTFVARQVGA
jgi:small subunit ribosomal protein S3